MPTLTIDEETSELAQQVARLTGRSPSDAIKTALRTTVRELRESPQASAEDLVDVVEQIAKRVAKLPVLDRRSDDDILGYDERGLWH